MRSRWAPHSRWARAAGGPKPHVSDSLRCSSRSSCPASRSQSALYLVFILPLRNVPFGDLGWFGTPGQLAGLITLLMPFATIIVFARLLMLDRHHEDSATDLGAPPSGVVRRIILPQIAPAIGAAFAVVFAGAMGEFVVVDVLVGANDTRALAPPYSGRSGVRNR